MLISRIVQSSPHEGPTTRNNTDYTDDRQTIADDNFHTKNKKKKFDDCGISNKKNTKKYNKIRMCSTCLVDLTECKDSSHCEVKELFFLICFDRNDFILNLIALLDLICRHS